MHFEETLEHQNYLVQNFLQCYQVFYLYRFGMRGTCHCKPTTTTEPPKQCKDLVNFYCKSDEECGEGGVCVG